jgi:hypothetical protein
MLSLLSPAIATARTKLRADLVRLGISAAAALLGCVGLGFLIAAAYGAIGRKLGYPESAAIVGAALLVLAMIVALLRTRRVKTVARDTLQPDVPLAAGTSGQTQPLPLGPLAVFVLGFVMARQAR